jgi:uncharacterized membrane protein
MKKRFTISGIVRHFFQGILILAPICFTAYVIYWLFTKMDNLVRIYIPHVGIVPGIGFLVVLIGVTIVGYLSSPFIAGRLFNLFDFVMERTPVIKYIYSTVKDVFGAFIGEKRKFDHPVLVHIYSDEVWEVGFITQNNLRPFGLTDMVAVYVPVSYAISGKVYLVRKEKILPLTQLSSGDAMKFAVSGGVTGITRH